MNRGSEHPDLEERVSYIRSAANGEKEDGYNDMKTPTDLEDGALVAGGALPLFSVEAFALYAQYGAIGIILSMIPNLNYPIFNIYLQLEGYQTASYRSLVTIGWSFKVFMGLFSDCFPIFGYRRKPWIMIGWTVTMICLAVMTFSPLGEPYCNREKALARHSKACKSPRSKANATDLDLFNPDAPNNGSLFIIMSMFTSLGYVTAACASDAMVVEYAQREPVAIRGRIQTAIYTVRTLTGIIATIVIGFGLNSPNYNGTFSFSISPNLPYAICLIPCVLAILSTIFVMKEEKKVATPLKVWVSNFWNLLQSRVMWQICAFRFINNCFQSINTTASSPVASLWANVMPLNEALSGILADGISAVILVAFAKWGLHWNWRWCIALSSIGVMIIDGSVAFITIWNVIRNQWFYNGVILADNVPASVRFIVATYCAVEVADVGNEGATYGLITTISNLAGPFASVIYKYVDSFFNITQDDIMGDSNQVRWHVTYTYLFSFGCKLFSLVWLFMLPPQRGPMQELKKKGGKSKLAAIILIVCFFACLSFAVSTSIMSIYPSTQCYRIAGGDGKTDPITGKCPMVASKKG